MKMTIGANIKRLRAAKEITQEQLSVAMNVTCAAVSKWERGETYPDITLLQPLAYYFGVTLDELMGYDQEKIAADIDEVLAAYIAHIHDEEGRAIITKAYHDYPNDYRVMHYYMWNVAGDLADNDPTVLIARKEELTAICEKLLSGCTDDNLRRGAWNMKAKLLHAEGKTEDSLALYRAKFSDWYSTVGQKCEQLFSKETAEYYTQLHLNLYQLTDFAADKLGRRIIFHPSLSDAEKTAQTLLYGDLLLNAFDATGDDFFLLMAVAFLSRVENDLCYRGGSNEAITSIMEKGLRAVKLLTSRLEQNDTLNAAYLDGRAYLRSTNLLAWNLSYRVGATGGRRAELLGDSAYAAVLERYK